MTRIQHQPTSRFCALLTIACLALLPACGGFGTSSRSAQKTGPQLQATGGGGGDGSGSYGSESSYHTTSTYRGPSGESSPAPGVDYAGSESESGSLARDGEARPGLGTTFGERRNSTVTRREFVRAHNRPFAQVALHYNSLEGIQKQSVYRGMRLDDLRAQTDNGGLSISLVDESGRLLQGGSGGGRTYVIGQDGQRYMIWIRNDTGGTYEVVSSVDGLDVVDGLPANTSKRGYIVEPYSTLTIDGFRTDLDSVAAFRFGAVDQSYAAQTSGDRNVGVIGFAFFAERGSRWTNDEVRRRESADPFPGDYAKPPSVVR